MNPTGQPFQGAPYAAPPQNNQVNLPAILLMVSAGLAIAYALFSLVMAAVGGDGDTSWVMKLINDPALREQMEKQMAAQQTGGGKLVNYLWPLLILAANGLVIFGALKMRSLESYALAMVAAVVATIPCCFTGCCCITSMPAGIFALVVLMRPEVKAAFRS